jgi:hypothetical protein
LLSQGLAIQFIVIDWSVNFDLIAWKGGSLKRSLGMASLVFTIPKAFGFEVATQQSDDNLQI